MRYNKKDAFSPENSERKEKVSKLEKIAIGALIVATATAILYGFHELYRYIINRREGRYR